jgi:flagellin FlaB
MRKFGKSDEAFTGLEAAIVLIAFVVVAAVFSYVMLGAGFFTSQKSQEVVHTGVQQASSSIELSGAMQGQANATASNGLKYVNFTLQSAAGGEGVDVSKITYTVSTASAMSKYTVSDSAVSGSFVSGYTDHDDLIEPGEFYQVQVDVNTFSLTPYDKFQIDVAPAVGTVLSMERTVPAALTANEWYELY